MKKSIRNILIGITVIIAVGMTLSLSACNNNENNAEIKSLYAQGLDVVQLMSEITQTEECVDIFTTSNEIKNVVQNISTGDYSIPKAVYAIFIADESLVAMDELDSLDNVSNGLKAFLKQRTLGALMVQINGMGGVENLAASSVCTVGKTFVNENATEDVIYLYTYENALPVAVTFTVGEDHAVSASGVFVMYDGFTCGSADEIKSFFSGLTIEVSEVLPEK